MAISPQDFDLLIRTRRSIFPKDYSGARVDDRIIRQMLENANWAPTHRLTEPWRFTVFTGKGLQTLGEFQAGCYKEITIANGSYRDEKYNDLLTKPLLSSHIIAVGMKRDEKKSVPEIEEIGAVFCAVQNMYLTATAYGVGCYLSTGGVTGFPEAKRFFGLGDEDKLIGFLHVGISKTNGVEGRRRPIADKTHWVD